MARCEVSMPGDEDEGSSPQGEVNRSADRENRKISGCPLEEFHQPKNLTVSRLPG
jgi:hypothetical protein